MHVSNYKGKDVEEDEVLKRCPVSQEFHDMFPTDILELLPPREVDFSIELVPGETLALKEPYMMSTLELVELKLKLKEMLDTEYFRPSLSP